VIPESRKTRHSLIKLPNVAIIDSAPPVKVDSNVFEVSLRTIVLIGLSTFVRSSVADSPSPGEPVTRVLFGSCVKQELPTPIFQTMLAENSDLVLFLGDNIYADTSDMSVMRAKYERLAANDDFVGLRSNVPILATWDDHDFGINDGGADFPMREAAKQEFHRFWNEPEDSPRRQREGVYDARIYGPPGKRLQIILLDTRYFRSPLKKGERRVGGPYLPDDDPTKTMLGKPQWKWLAEQLRKPAELRLIVSSIQCIAEAAGQETWSNLPRERKRLFDMIKETKANGVVLLSGDRHWSELSKLDHDLPYPLYDLTSSSFNQIHERGTPTVNRFRDLATTYHRENYGVISVDWDRKDPSLTMQIRDISGDVEIEKRVGFQEIVVDRSAISTF
jgi:alkaline phosphatase D